MSREEKVRVWESDVEIPTYGVGEPNKNPMFLEKRVYQGSSGKVYPYPVIDKIEDEKNQKSYRIVVLENEYLHIEIMPELGGRIYRALDKTNQYDFVYYNRVIKPALVGLAGPWISGGIEFNWPQHHRPNTFGPVEYTVKENPDDSKTVWVSEVDRMYGTKGMAGFTLFPGKAYLEITGQLYNRTPHPQSFLWWANPAVAVNDHTQSVFPPDVHAVFDHGKRDVSRFPIATGTYYKMDYSAGVDISRYKNIPVPTSYMAYRSDYNFVGGYDHSVKAGILHVANHHISPGKKQWTWGCGEFGKAWDRNLTDEDGPYIELMTGVYTDNQPDFSWLQPYEEKTFKQYFMPYKNIGIIKNATIDAAVHLEVHETQAILKVYASSEFKDAQVILKSKSKTYLQQTVASLSPTATFSEDVALDIGVQPHHLYVSVLSSAGKELVSYHPEQPAVEPIPEAAKAIGLPEQLTNTEALYLAAQHLEQYRHATYEPDAYYMEGLKRDPGDIRLNNGYGALLLRRGLFEESEGYFRKAIETSIKHNPNPYDSEPYYNLGLCLKMQERLDEAYNAYYKAIWSAAWQDKGYFTLAQIACSQGSLEDALELIEKSIMKNYRNYKARHLKTAVLRNSGVLEEAERTALETIRFDIADFGARNELALIYRKQGMAEQAEAALHELAGLMRNDPHNYIALAHDYAECGLFDEAVDVLSRIMGEGCEPVYPMVLYSLGYFEQKRGNVAESRDNWRRANEANPDYCFPNQLSDFIVLMAAIEDSAEYAKAHYYLGNLLYDKKRHLDAIHHWEKSVALDSGYPTTYRNLALAYYNKKKDASKAIAALEKAFSLNRNDARVFYELDQLYKKMGYTSQQRFAVLERYPELLEKRDDLYIEYVTLLNLLNRHQEAMEWIMKRKFHPWEGGEGKVTSQYVLCHMEIAKQCIKKGSFEQAIEQLMQAKQYPENIGEGKLAGAQENLIHYYLGLAFHALGRMEEAEQAFGLASQGLDEPTSAMFYNDQPPEMIFYQGLALQHLNQIEPSRGKFNKLVDYGEKHLFQPLTIDYFAVSLPDFLVFDEDLDRKNEIHCRFMMALGYLGLGKQDQAKEQLRKVLELEPCHQGAQIHLGHLQ